MRSAFYARDNNTPTGQSSTYPFVPVGQITIILFPLSLVCSSLSSLLVRLSVDTIDTIP